MKKILSILCAVAILVSTMVTVSAKNEIKVFNNKVVADDGQETALNSATFSYWCQNKEYVYVPIDEIAPLLGIGLGWDSERNAEICLYGENKMLISPDKNEAESNGEMVWMNCPAVMKDNRFYISSEHIKDLTGKTILKGENLKEYGTITVIGKSKKAFVNDRQIELSQEPYKSANGIIVPMDSMLNSIGYALGWDGERGATIATKNGETKYIYLNKGMIESQNESKTYSYKPQIIGNEAYITEEMFYEVTGYKVIGYGEIKSFGGRFSIMDSTRTDAYRLSGNVVRGGGVTVVGTFGMELVSASDVDSKNYAGVINALAETIPNCNVYNIVVPTSAEFYAPSNIAPNQLKGIQTVYQNLSDRVTPINVYDALKEHANEKIYFATDHHWTQRGAYYAYKEFIEAKGGTIDDLSTFENIPSYNMVGSFAGFAKGTQAGNIMRANPELLERFMPKYATVGTVFSDGLATRKSYTVSAVNAGNNSYSCFIGGDGPVTIFHTDANSDETVLIIKESFGNAFATWAMHNYKKVCVVDPRKFNGFGGNYAYFNLKAFCNAQGVDDVVFINYPVAVGSSGIRSAILNMK